MLRVRRKDEDEDARDRQVQACQGFFWTWGRFDTEWAKAKVEWQGQLTVKLLRSLKAFGRIA